MDDTTPTPSPPAAPPPPYTTRPRWQRPRDRRMLAGVAQGAADALGIGVGWVRAAFVVLFLFGGLALPLYIAGWLLMPNEDDQDSIASRWASGMGGEGVRWLGVGLIVVAAVVLLSSTGLVRGGWIWAASLLVIGVLLYRGDLDIGTRKEGSPERPSPPDGHDATSGLETLQPGAPEATDPFSDAAVAEYAASVDAGIDEPTGPVRTALPPPPPPPPPPPRPRSILGRLTFAAVLLSIGTMALLDNLDVARPDGRHYIALVIAVLGVALIVGAWWGRTRGSIVVGLLLAPLLVLTTVVHIPFEGDIGDKRYRPATVAELESPYEMAIGELRIDLRDLTEDAAVTADLGIGLLWVIVPADADVMIASDIGIGELDLLELTRGGLGIDRTVSSSGDGPELVLDLEVGIGEVRVDRAGR